jgi:DNA (cytosine-5)-methyltransferase 1
MVNLKVLNLYAGIGGNRKLWEDVDVTAVEWDPKIAAVYQDFFPDDKVVVGDAHQYLLDYHKEFDFIWSSPPCPTHSITNHFLHAQGTIRYPDMKLYEEIIFLQTFYYGGWVVENVRSYYKPLIRPQELARHYFWSNVYLLPFNEKKDFNMLNCPNDRMQHTRQLADDNLRTLQDYHGFDMSKYKIATYDKRKMLRNCVYPPLGKHILSCARGNTQQTLI